MSLDQNLFTLTLAPNPSYPAGTVVDLTDASGTIHYRKRRIVSEQQQVYRIEVSGTEAPFRTYGQGRLRRSVQIHSPMHCWRVRLPPARRPNTRPWSSTIPRTSSSSSTPARSPFDGLSNGRRKSSLFPIARRRRCYFFPIADTNSNGNAKNASSFASRTHPCSSR